MADTPENWFFQKSKKWKRTAAAHVKGTLRRKRDEFLPSPEAREHEKWIARQFEIRKGEYTHAPVPGLLSILTPVWDGSPAKYLRELAASIAEQNGDAATEWVLLDNGCRRPELLACLREISSPAWVKLLQRERNVGITQGLQLCLEAAVGRYVLPVDGDDRLDSDALRVVTSAIVRHGYPPLLYTDEDKIIGSRRYQPYFKPAWDPVLLLNSAYIAHLGVIDRRLALQLGAYSDSAVEASPDWDLFVRFLSAGYEAVHLPEIVYSWRVHAQSTADDAASKPAVHASQKRVLQRYLDGRQDGSEFSVEYNPLFGGAPHFYLRSKEAVAIQAVRWNEGNWREKLSGIEESEFALMQHDEVEILSPDWAREATGLFRLYPDAVMIGGRIADQNGRIVALAVTRVSGEELQPAGAGCSLEDPGYFGKLWKRCSVTNVSARLAVIRVSFFQHALVDFPEAESIERLSMLAGVGGQVRRVIYSPFLTGLSRKA